jgi:hypothetical protein
MPMRWASRLNLAIGSMLLLAATVASAPSIADVVPLPREQAERRQGMRAALDSIRLGDGMSLNEASIIARVYFFTYVSGCGGPFDPHESAGTWRFTILIGAAGGYAGEIEIQASTGRMVSDQGAVLFATLGDLRRDAVDHFGRRFWRQRLLRAVS